MRALPGRAKRLVIATSTLAAGVLVLALRSDISADSTRLALLLAAAVVTELFYVRGSEEPIHASAMHGFSFSAGVHLAAAYLVGPWEAATIALVGTGFVDTLRGYPRVKVVFNGAVFALSTAAAGLAFLACGGTTTTLDLPGALPAILASVVAYVVVNVTLVSTIVGIVTDTPIWPTLTASVQAEMISTGAEAGAAGAIALMAHEAPWGILTLIPLLVAAYQSHKRLSLLQDETSEAMLSLAALIDERDPYTFQHSQRVSEHVHRLGKALGLPGITVTRFKWAARVHDLGKVSLESSILHKPGKLEGSEWAQMRRHPRTSARLINGFRFARDLARVVECHHERYDGHGYYGVSTADVPLGAHFLTVADTFDAMTTDRPYRRGLSTEAALAEIERQAGTQFHPGVARAFVAMIRGEDPGAALSPIELLGLRNAARPPRRRLLPLLRNLHLHHDRTMLGGALVALVGVATEGRIVPLLGLGLFGAGAVLRANDRRRSSALSTALEAALDVTSVVPRRLRLVLATLVPYVSVRWGAFVRWNEESLEAEVLFEDGVIHDRPSDAALASWLLQQTGATSVHRAVEGSPVGADGAFTAIPIHQGDELLGFLVVATDRRLPGFARAALTSCGVRLSRCLHGNGPVAPVLRAVS